MTITISAHVFKNSLPFSLFKKINYYKEAYNLKSNLQFLRFTKIRLPTIFKLNYRFKKFKNIMKFNLLHKRRRLLLIKKKKSFLYYKKIYNYKLQTKQNIEKKIRKLFIIFSH